MSFVTVMNFVLRNIKFMLLGGLLLAIISPLPLIGRAPKYTSSVRFLTEAERPAGRFLGDLALPGTAGRGPDFYLDLMRSPVVLQGVAKAPLELEPGQPPVRLVDRMAPGEKDPEVAARNVADALQGWIGAGVSNTGIVTLRVTADDPRIAAAVAREMIVQVDNFNETKMRSQARREREFAEERLVVVERELRQAEAEWLQFVQRNRIVSAPTLQLEQGRIQDSLGRKRALAATLVQAIERSRLDEVRESPRAVVLTPPVVPGNPSTISWQRVALVGFFAGMIIFAMIALVRDYFRSVSRQPTPEAQEFAALRAASTQSLARPIRAIFSGARSRPTQPPLQ